MEIMVRPRRGGKTTAMIERLRANPKAVMIVFNSHIKENIIREVPLGEQRSIEDRLMTSQQWKNYGKSGDYDELLIDNLDMILPGLLDANRQRLVVTATGVYL